MEWVYRGRVGVGVQMQGRKECERNVRSGYGRSKSVGMDMKL